MSAEVGRVLQHICAGPFCGGHPVLRPAFNHPPQLTVRGLCTKAKDTPAPGNKTPCLSTHTLSNLEGGSKRGAPGLPLSHQERGQEDQRAKGDKARCLKVADGHRATSASLGPKSNFLIPSSIFLPIATKMMSGHPLPDSLPQMRSRASPPGSSQVKNKKTEGSSFVRV